MNVILPLSWPSRVILVVLVLDQSFGALKILRGGGYNRLSIISVSVMFLWLQNLGFRAGNSTTEFTILNPFVRMIFSVQAKNLVFIAVKKAFFRARFDITDVSQFTCNVRGFQIDNYVFRKNLNLLNSFELQLPYPK